MNSCQRSPLERVPVVDLRAEVLDQLAELIVFAAGPAERASVIAALVAELSALVEWSQGAPADAGELAGARRLVAAAEAHLCEMQSVVGG